MDINPGRAMKEAVARPPHLASLAPVAGLLAVASCYGTLGVVALLSVIGVAVPLNEVLLVRIVTVVLAIALLGMAYSFRMHRDIKPSLLGIASAALLFWVFYGEYSRPLEALGRGPHGGVALGLPRKAPGLPGETGGRGGKRVMSVILADAPLRRAVKRWLTSASSKLGRAPR